MQTKQQATCPHKQIENKLSLKIEVNDSRIIDFLEFLQKQYPPGSKKINLGSVYQIPIGSKGVKLFTQYCNWKIQMLNLTMHEIRDEGLQYIIQQGISSKPQTCQKSQKLSELQQLSIIKNNITSQGFKDIEKISLQKMRVLRASENFIDNLGVARIVQCNWPNLRQLDLSSNKIGKDTCKMLMNSKWKMFQRLDLKYNLIGNEGIHYLTEADWPELMQINLSHNKLDATSSFYFKNANWPKLRSLILNRNQIGKLKGQSTTLGCLNLCLLKSDTIERLSLYGNEITLASILILLQSKKLTTGCFLQLSRNHFRFQDIKETLEKMGKFCNEFQS